MEGVAAMVVEVYSEGGRIGYAYVSSAAAAAATNHRWYVVVKLYICIPEPATVVA